MPRFYSEGDQFFGKPTVRLQFGAYHKEATLRLKNYWGKQNVDIIMLIRQLKLITNRFGMQTCGIIWETELYEMTFSDQGSFVFSDYNSKFSFENAISISGHSEPRHVLRIFLSEYRIHGDAREKKMIENILDVVNRAIALETEGNLEDAIQMWKNLYSHQSPKFVSEISRYLWWNTVKFYRPYKVYHHDMTWVDFTKEIPSRDIDLNLYDFTKIIRTQNQVALIYHRKSNRDQSIAALLDFTNEGIQEEIMSVIFASWYDRASIHFSRKEDVEFLQCAMIFGTESMQSEIYKLWNYHDFRNKIAKFSSLSKYDSRPSRCLYAMGIKHEYNLQQWLNLFAENDLYRAEISILDQEIDEMRKMLGILRETEERILNLGQADVTDMESMKEFWKHVMRNSFDPSSQNSITKYFIGKSQEVVSNELTLLGPLPATMLQFLTVYEPDETCKILGNSANLQTFKCLILTDRDSSQTIWVFLLEEARFTKVEGLRHTNGEDESLPLENPSFSIRESDKQKFTQIQMRYPKFGVKMVKFVKKADPVRV